MVCYLCCVASCWRYRARFICILDTTASQKHVSEVLLMCDHFQRLHDPVCSNLACTSGDVPHDSASGRHQRSAQMRYSLNTYYLYLYWCSRSLYKRRKASFGLKYTTEDISYTFCAYPDLLKSSHPNFSGFHHQFSLWTPHAIFYRPVNFSDTLSNSLNDINCHKLCRKVSSSLSISLPISLK